MANYGGSHSSNQIQKLPPATSDANFAQKINEIIDKLNAFLFAPNEVTSAYQLVVNREVIANHASTRVVLTLPLTAQQGDTVTIRGKGAAGWKVAQNALQTIHGSSNTTTGVTGSIASGATYNCVTLECITPSTDWIIATHEGTLTFV